METARQQGYLKKVEEDHGIKVCFTCLFCLLLFLLLYLFLFFPLQILTLAVLVILLTAPLGAVGIALCGPRLLQEKVSQVNPAGTAGSMEENQEFIGHVTTRGETVM